jgi:hypothetical protein
MRNLPAHQQHQKKSEQQKKQRREAVLDADDFVVGRKNVAAQEARVVMRVLTVIVFIVTVRWELVKCDSHAISLRENGEWRMTNGHSVGVPTFVIRHLEFLGHSDLEISHFLFHLVPNQRRQQQWQVND